jgi:hypothetical protein
MLPLLLTLNLLLNLGALYFNFIALKNVHSHKSVIELLGHK